MEPKRNQGIPKTERQAAGCVTATLTSVCTRPRRPSRRRRRAVARGRLVGKSEMHTQTPQAGPPTCHGPGSLQASKGICAHIGQARGHPRNLGRSGTAEPEQEANTGQVTEQVLSKQGCAIPDQAFQDTCRISYSSPLCQTATPICCLVSVLSVTSGN